MFLLDDILLSPARGLLAVFHNLHDAAEEEFVHEAEAIRIQLSEMYVMLETGQLSEHEFDRREQVLLDRLEKVETRGEMDIADDDEEVDENSWIDTPGET